METLAGEESAHRLFRFLALNVEFTSRCAPLRRNNLPSLR